MVIVLMLTTVVHVCFSVSASVWPNGLRLFGHFAFGHPFGCRYGCYVVRAVVEHPDAVPDLYCCRRPNHACMRPRILAVLVMRM